MTGRQAGISPSSKGLRKKFHGWAVCRPGAFRLFSRRFPVLFSKGCRSSWMGKGQARKGQARNILSREHVQGLLLCRGTSRLKCTLQGTAGENIPSGSKNYVQSWIKTGSFLHFHKLVLLNVSEMGGIVICHWEACFYIFMSATIKPQSHLFLRMYL